MPDSSFSDSPFLTEKHYFGPNGEPWDIKEWGAYFESPERIIRQTVIGENVAEVSTVWIGTHRWTISCVAEADPNMVIYETMIFAPDLELNELQLGASTRDQALDAHVAMLTAVLEEMGIELERASALALWATGNDAGQLVVTVPDGHLEGWQPLDRGKMAQDYAEVTQGLRNDVGRGRDVISSLDAWTHHMGEGAEDAD